MNQTRPSTQLDIGSLIFPQVDQIDFTGPFEVFSRIPSATCLIIAKERGPIRDARGLILTPEKTFSEVGQLDLLHVPGGPGQETLMDDEETLSFIRQQSINAKYIFSVCTGALILGAAGLLRGKKATTHWAAFQLLSYFGAIPVDERVVLDGNLIILIPTPPCAKHSRPPSAKSIWPVICEFSGLTHQARTAAASSGRPGKAPRNGTIRAIVARLSGSDRIYAAPGVS
jgi:putative intracellular protease/amidase